MKDKESKKSETLRAYLDQIESVYNVRKSEHQLELLGLVLMANDERVSEYVLEQQTPLEADLTEYWTGGSGDGGIDGLLWDPSRQCISILQATYRNAWNEDIAEKARSFFAKLPEWADEGDSETKSKYNDKTNELLRESELSLQTSDARLIFITNIPVGEAPANKLIEIAEIQTKEYQNAGRAVTCEVWGQSQILNQWEEMENTFSHRGIEGKTTLKFQKDNFFELESPYRTIVGAISTNEIRNLFRRQNVRNVIFNTNIRLALGGKNKINKGIQDTLVSEPESFFYFNNGVTATCSSYSKEQNLIELENLQVVNGAQTVSTIGNSKDAENSLVLLRIIETGDRYKAKNQFSDQITKYQNTQNPVKASDFYSTDDFQVWLSKNLSDRATKLKACREFWYQHKRGWTPSKSNGVKVEMETLAKLRHSMLVNPNRTYNSPRDFWESGNYWEAFGSNGEECKLWTELEIAEVAWGVTVFSRLRDYVKSESEANKKGQPSNPETAYLSYLSIFATAVGFQFIKHLQSLEGTQKAPDFVEIMSSKSLFERYFTVMTKVRESILDAINRRLREKEANPKFYLARDREEFSAILDSLKQKYASHLFEI